MSNVRFERIALISIVLFAFIFVTPIFESAATERMSVRHAVEAQTLAVQAHEVRQERQIRSTRTQSERPVSIPSPVSDEADETQSEQETRKETIVEDKAEATVVPLPEPKSEPEVKEKPIVTLEVAEEKEVSIVEEVVPVSADDSEAPEFLTLHNQARSEYNLPPFTWSDVLADGAEDWAETLTGRDCALEHSSEPYGENLFSLWSNNSSVHGTPEDAMDWWMDEEKYYNYETNSCADGEVCGHYTQIVWETTTAVGCAMAQCTDEKGTTDLFVCRYSPPGNIPGKKPY